MLLVLHHRLDRTGGAQSDPIDSDRNNDHVRELATSSDAALEIPVAPGPTPRLAAVIVLIVAIFVTAALLGLSYEPAESVATTRAPAALSGHPSIAVLPFLNRGNDPRQKDFDQGISEDLATDLSKLSRLHVISSDSLANERRWMSMQHVAHELGVRYLLHGSVRRAGDRVRINAEP